MGNHVNSTEQDDVLRRMKVKQRVDGTLVLAGILRVCHRIAACSLHRRLIIDGHVNCLQAAALVRSNQFRNGYLNRTQTSISVLGSQGRVVTDEKFVNHWLHPLASWFLLFGHLFPLRILATLTGTDSGSGFDNSCGAEKSSRRLSSSTRTLTIRT